MSKTVGQQLRQAREARSLSLEQAAQATRIRAHYIKAMEDGELDTLPSATQARGFLRAYAGFLNLDSEALLAVLEGEKVLVGTTAPDASPPPLEPPVSSPVEQEEETETIFIQIGQRIQRQRDLLGLSLDDVERHTHLRQHYLRALEAGNLEGLPSPVQGRGMLENYASFLGLDPEPLLLQFAEGLQIRLATKQATHPRARPVVERRSPRLPAPLRRLFSGDILIGGALAVFLIIFAVWGAIRIFAQSSEQTPTSAAPSIADVLLASPTTTATSTPEPPTATIPPAQLLFPTQALATDALTGAVIPANPQTDIQIYITVRQRAWMRVTVDGEIEFDGRVLPGSAYPFLGKEQVEVLTGNGAGLQIFFNSADLGVMGAFGEVAHQIYSQEGILNPTPTITQTPTATLPPTPTPRTTATMPAIP
jgi:cytoskeletal protein RodZ